MLSNMQIQKAVSKEKDYKLSDEKGMYLLVSKAGGKYWRLNYRYAGKRKTLALGVYPTVSLKEAREARDEAKRQLREGIDPSAQKQLIKLKRITSSENTFEAIARDWQSRHLADKSNSHVTRSTALLDKDLMPSLGRRPIAEIEPVELLSVLRVIENRSVDMAHRARALAGQIFRYGIQIGQVKRDPTADLKGALKSKHKTHYAAIIEPEPFGELLKAIDHYSGTLTVCNALMLAPMLLLRPGNLRMMQWHNINWEKSQLEYSAEEMKTKDRPHIVPLPQQAMDVLTSQQMYSGNFPYVFPSGKSPRRPLSDNGMRTALLTMGYGSSVQTVHGFRSSARTMMEEQLNIPPHLIEHQLHHMVKDPNGRAYNRATHLEARRAMMQQWADYLDQLK